MALTFYLPSSGAPANSPAFETSYTDSSQADRIAATSTKGSTALASKSVNVSASGSNVYYLVRQYVLPQIKAHDFTTSETFDLVLRCLESAAGLDATLCLCIKVMSGDCATDRGSLIDSRINTTEFGTSLQSRYCQTKAFTSARSAQAGDRLVLEFYARCDSPDAGSIEMNFGEDASTALSLSNSDTDADYPYITINAAIELYATGYTLACGGGSYALTGQAMSPKRDAKVSATAGEYAVTGQAAGAYYGRKVQADAGQYALTGQNAGTRRTALLSAGAGEYALTGAEAGLRRAALLSAAAGEYALSGQVAGLRRAARLALEAGTYELTGTAGALVCARKLNAEAGAYSVSGQGVTLLVTSVGAYVLTAEGGVYALAGQGVGLLKDARLGTEAGAYAVTGHEAGTLLGRVLDAGAGTYEITGQAATLLRAAKIIAEGGTYSLTGKDAAFLLAVLNQYVLAASPGAYAIVGKAVGLTKGIYAPALAHTAGGPRLAHSGAGQLAHSGGSRRLARATGGDRLAKTSRASSASTKIREN